MKNTCPRCTFEPASELPASFEDGRRALIVALKGFGFDESEALIYLGLLQTGPITVGSLAARIEMDRAKTYRSLDKLKNSGLVSTSLSNPTICTAAEPSSAIESIIEKKYDEIQSMRKLSERIICGMEEFRKEIASIETPYFSIIQGRPMIYSKIGKMIQHSKCGTIFLVTTLADLMQMYHTSIPEKISVAALNGTRVYILTESGLPPNIGSLVRKIGATEIRVTTLPSSGRMIVEKDRQIVISGITGKSSDMNNHDDSVVHTNSLEIVQNIYSLCEHLWKNSKPMPKS